MPQQPRQRIGFQLDKVQHGYDPDDWKSMETVGPGAREIRVKDENGIYRAIYVAKFEEAIYVLHCFQKKSEKTEQHDIEVARKRYNELLAERNGK